jgi:hypothetical protein
MVDRDVALIAGSSTRPLPGDRVTGVARAGVIFCYLLAFGQSLTSFPLSDVPKTRPTHHGGAFSD